MSRFWILLLTFPLLGFTFLDPVARKNDQGNRSFEEGKYEEALQFYRDAQVENPEAPQLRYNAGDALYKQQDYEQALQEFGRALQSKDGGMLAQAYYNMGNVYFRQEKLQEAVEAYKRSLEIDSSDMDAKVNLEVALKKLEEQKQDQQDKDQQDKDQQDKDQQDKDQQDKDQQDKDQQPGDQQDKDQQDKDQQDKDQQDKDQQPGDQDQQEPRKAGELTREEAQRLLDAMKDREAEAQKRRRVRLSGQTYNGNEW
ncbi:MAG: tetratricopeptide repeat protein [bacterium]|nr:tetratricopeptide repeat protein [bacterium]